MHIERPDQALGINGFGRIGKLFLWRNLGRKHFGEVVVNVGRQVGRSLADIAHYLERDSTYGLLRSFLYGYGAKPLIKELDEERGSMVVDGVTVRFLRSTRNPARIPWRDLGVKLVVDTTGRFIDPVLPGDAPNGSVRGHLSGGAEKVIVSAPFKIGTEGLSMPEDAVTTVMGINENDYDPRRHRIVSNASCTTTCLAHMMKPLIHVFGAGKILSASMATIHSATGSQQVLDRLPKTGAGDLRKNRSIMNNIILTSTGAAKALRLVIPEMERIGFIAESVRVPVATGSLVILVVNFQEDLTSGSIRRGVLNDIYKRASSEDPRRYLHYTDKQNVSLDIIGEPHAAAVIEGNETHTRTAEVRIDLNNVPGMGSFLLPSARDAIIRVPVTQAVIYGWYDNEMGSYVNMLVDRAISIAAEL